MRFLRADGTDSDDSTKPVYKVRSSFPGRVPETGSDRELEVVESVVAAEPLRPLGYAELELGRAWNTLTHPLSGNVMRIFECLSAGYGEGLK
jgi:hypothetical protein